MARKRRKSSKAKRPEMVKTTQRQMTLVSGTASQLGMTVPVDRLLSQANSKLYRQGMNYHCSSKPRDDYRTCVTQGLYVTQPTM